MVSTAAQRTGQRGEEAAARLLTRSGLRIVARNWRHGSLELDLVCEDRDELVFVEVRTRAATGMSSAAESITPAKQRTLVKAARAYLAAHQAWHRPCRFDAVCIMAEGDTLNLEHIRHAFDSTAALDCRHTAWQL